jgi:hypothetical protein
MINCQAQIWINVVFFVLLFVVFTPGILFNLPPAKAEKMALLLGRYRSEDGKVVVETEKVKWWERMFCTGVVEVASFVLHILLAVCFSVLFFYLTAAFVVECM